MVMNFKSEQKKYSRIKLAYQEKYVLIQQLYHKHNLLLENSKIYLRAFKTEKILEVWAAPNEGNKPFQLIISYEFSAFSGVLGPKRKEGDLQIPEGIYHINRFNPCSKFHLSLGINYPNKADSFLSITNLGGDIFIHGDSFTVGCISITDDKIKELYILCVEAKNAGQKEIPVHLFPYRLNNPKHYNMLIKYPEHKKLWSELKSIFSNFERTKLLAHVSINKSIYSIK